MCLSELKLGLLVIQLLPEVMDVSGMFLALVAWGQDNSGKKGARTVLEMTSHDCRWQSKTGDAWNVVKGPQFLCLGMSWQTSFDPQL